MTYLVHGRDSAAFVHTEHPLHEEHQTFMDAWAPQLTARGPTLSDDGSTHTGSVHVLDTHDPRVAERFAFDEPFARAGWYAEITVTPFETLLPGTMWDHPLPTSHDEASFVLVSCAPSPRSAAVVDPIRTHLTTGADDPPWSFLGLLLDAERAAITGLAGSLVRPTAATTTWLRARLATLPLTRPAVTATRWRRGGR